MLAVDDDGRSLKRSVQTATAPEQCAAVGQQRRRMVCSGLTQYSDGRRTPGLQIEHSDVPYSLPFHLTASDHDMLTVDKCRRVSRPRSPVRDCDRLKCASRGIESL